MCTRLRVHRDILASWRNEFGEDEDSAGDIPPTESPTRAG